MNAIWTLSNLITELSLRTKWHITWHLHMISAQCVAHDLHTVAPGPLERVCWRQFAALWGDCKKSQIAPLNATIIIIIIIKLSEQICLPDTFRLLETNKSYTISEVPNPDGRSPPYFHFIMKVAMGHHGRQFIQEQCSSFRPSTGATANHGEQAHHFVLLRLTHVLSLLPANKHSNNILCVSVLAALTHIFFLIPAGNYPDILS